jgi:transketolase
LNVWRPCDTVESAVAWKCALEERQQPHALVFTRQGLPHQERSPESLALIERGGYVLHDTGPNPQVALIATGSEVALAMDAAEELAPEVDVRVISMPNPDRFMAQDDAYCTSVLPPSLQARVAVEAGVTNYWRGLAGDGGDVIGINSFGASAPASVLFDHFGITVSNIVSAARSVLNTD